MNYYQHQKDIIELSPDRYGMFWEVGTGKTVGVLGLLKTKDIPTALVVCPKSIVSQWEDYFINWGMLGVVKSKETFRRDHAKIPAYQALIIDEVHFFSGYKSQMHKSALAYIKRCQPRQIYLLTGTPYLSSVWNIYALGKILGKNWQWHVWDSYFFDHIKMGARIVPVQKKVIKGHTTEQIVASLVNQIGNTVKMEDCVDLPEQIYETEYFDLTKEQKDGIRELTDVLPIVRFTHEHQICGGSLKSDGYTATRYFKSEKLDRLLELVAEHPLMAVVCRYNNEIDHIKEQIHLNYPSKPVWVIRGNCKQIGEAKLATDAVVLIQAAVSEGYELGNIPLMVFYSYDFSLKNYIQIAGRIRRINNLKSNVYLSLVCKGTIDEDIFKNITIIKQDFQIQIYERA